MQEQLFLNKVVWVTGAAKGIGRAIAQQFVDQGAEVIGFDIAFGADNYPFVTQRVDISDAAAVTAMAQSVLAQQPQLDVLVNVAGILRLGEVEQLTVDDWQACLDVNVSGPFYLLQQVIPTFKRQHHGAIVNVSSNAAHVPRQLMSAYCASKAALTSLSHCVALELAPFGVRCNLVSPGSTDTDMQRALWHSHDAEQRTIEGFPSQFKLGIPLGKIAKPQDIAGVVLFLASEAANHVTMQDIVVDGGAILNA
ncbi:2,3-dihydro-2,3-dihydroxybenzoate dehydrogenase [Motilimonas cestriensis]|uniref:2,3-dihydro-2,3-dihydroxybenzoate dehydrogenase n=1 Tax=Motilimonas cestriensis TaxID=2742685 RepID=A0ABS8WI08_9GAMM|nr:2,3-dihydro-2,3-dihydroxybenzoate dehydrogenase [Motilimonas cestriensis]MCE2597005.1 2,3-dihydro-2,3-dihydroxybenzoate dehydrogenase [Motilimonas cestriensis]